MAVVLGVWRESDIGELVFVDVGGGRVYATSLDFVDFLDRVECLEFVSVVLGKRLLRKYGFKGGVATASDLAVGLVFFKRRGFLKNMDRLVEMLVDKLNEGGSGLFAVCMNPKRIVKIYEGKVIGRVAVPGLYVGEGNGVVTVYYVANPESGRARVYVEVPLEPDYKSITSWLDYYAVYWRRISWLVGLLSSGDYGESGRHALGVLSTIELMLKATYGNYGNWLNELKKQGVKIIADE